MTRQLAVLGSPIGQALSPVLHRAAYQELGLDWTYRAVDCGPDRLPAFLAGLDDTWAGLSLTMPLKRTAVPLLHEVSDTVRTTGCANTVTIRGGRFLGETPTSPACSTPCARWASPGWNRRACSAQARPPPPPLRSFAPWAAPR